MRGSWEFVKNLFSFSAVPNVFPKRHLYRYQFINQVDNQKDSHRKSIEYFYLRATLRTLTSSSAARKESVKLLHLLKFQFIQLADQSVTQGTKAFIVKKKLNFNF